MSNEHEEDYFPEIVGRFPITGPDHKDRDRTSAIVTTSANATALAAHWIASDPNGTSFEATMSVKYREGWFKSRSITTKISVRKF